MQIRDVRCILAYGGRQTWVFVHVDTDAGITGIGEASLEGKELAVQAAVGELARFIVGRDPTRIEQNWQIMYRHGFWRGGVVLNTAISGIEQALWDIVGKELGVPVYRLLGGACRDKVQLYTHVGGRTPEALARNAQELVSKGWRALKTGGLPLEAYATEGQFLRATAQRMQALRDAVGPDVQLMVDGHGRYAPPIALRLARTLEAYDLTFFEEPVPPDDVDAYAPLAQAGLNVTLAAGERLFTKWGYRQFLERRYVGIIQPDVCHDGGILETRKIAAMAEAQYIRVAPHNPNGPVATAASVHLGACMPSFSILEYAENQPWRDQVLAEPWPVVGGCMELPRAPGLGVELNYEAIARLPYQPKDYQGAFWPDGGVADV